ncbi:hypothetical protein HPB48_005722 [Haemaphysalis longicornis]|uniref:Peptidase aspartic putative domain-containing protein n=1 Tax=Haemaphysalis longicornis TaxID=44386 RepID=A0A9J6F6U1_HAELO|nr:hypothetical protein HPB48_005722 [Haemaphysalis longicornis]
MRTPARHALSVCSPRKNNARDLRFDGSPNPRTTVCASVGKKSGIDTSGCVLVQTFRAWELSDNACRYIRGIFDGGSQRTFVSEELCKHLKLECIGFIDIALNTFANAKRQPDAMRRIVELRLKSQFSDTEVVVSAIEITHIFQDIEGSTMNSSFVLACKASGKDIADELLHPDVITRGGISILMGSDQMRTIMSGDLVRTHENQALVAINTKLGWTFQGSSTEVTATANTSRTMVCVLRADVTQCDDILRPFSEVESVGILDPMSSSTSKSAVLEHLENVSLRHGRNEVALPWKAHTSKLPSEPLYVDNLVTGGDSVGEPTRLFSEARGIMKATGMTFRKWTSNSDELMQHLEREDRRVCKGMVVHHESTVKVRGTAWDLPRGIILFHLSNILAFLKANTGTKRFILQATSRIFDPLGFGPCTMLAKLLFQKLWPRGTCCDQQPPQDLQNEWDQWVLQLPNMEEIAVTRRLIGEDKFLTNWNYTSFAVKTSRRMEWWYTFSRRIP